MVISVRIREGYMDNGKADANEAFTAIGDECNARVA